MYKDNLVTAVILAAGCGKRIGAGINKLLLEISGKSILSYTINFFDKNPFVDSIVLVCAENEMSFAKKLAENEITEKTFCIVKGGSERRDSSYLGIKAAKDGIVMIHDGARPFCDNRIIEETLKGTVEFGASAPGILVTDTVKRTENGFIKETVERESLVRIQTPQVFFKEDILKAHEKALELGIQVTDDCMLFEMLGKKVKVVEGSEENIKITTRSDLSRAKELIRNKKREKEGFSKGRRAL